MHRLSSLPYRDRTRATRELASLAPHLPPAVQNRFDLLLAGSPAPEQGLHYFTRLREQHPAAFDRLARSAIGLRYLVTVFTYSRFLAEEILEHPDWAAQLLDPVDLQRVVSADDLRTSLEIALPPGLPPPLELAKFRRRQILRIMIRDVIGLGTLPEITGELSAVADVLVEVAYERIYQDLVAHHGKPQSEDPSKGNEAHFAVIALGKMGAQELNYSSDIDLMFLYSANGQTAGPAPISNKEFFKRASNQLTGLLSAYSAEGMCYRVDLRLRPDGRLGEVCLSVDGAQNYYEKRARDWELQMLIKARVAAGHRPTGRALLDFVEPRIYSTSLDFSAIEELSATRERLNEKLAARQANRRARPSGIDVKLERGGIRDIEFLVQCLQRLHGGAEPWVRHGGTMLALARLQDKGFLTGAEYGRLAQAYQFLRHLEHRLQLDEDRQTHRLPEDPAALELIARRMPGGGSADWLMSELHNHLADVLEMYERVVHSRPAGAVPAEPDAQAGGDHTPFVIQALERRAPALAAAIARADLHRGYRPFEYFLERLSHDPARLERLNSEPELAATALDLFEHSPYFAEELIRRPESADELARVYIPLIQDEPPPHDATELRRWFRRAILRIEAESICRSHPIFETLDSTSRLADSAIARVYEIAIADVVSTNPPEKPGYEPSNQMSIIALGRLGMREFDLASDADLVFVLPDSAASEMIFWTRVAERVVNLITAYTGEGVLFAVDTRLRPNGSAGPLVQTESAVTEYFAHAAEAWEGITYMKSLAVAGDPKRGELFLHELQQVDWRRYGQSGRSRADLRQMRARLEKEQGPSRPLKAGRGGYYDIDFLLMYLRLKSAGVFFTVLNTPARIEVLENMGHLSRQDAQFLNDAATFYRALDHGLRVITGHAESRLPGSDAQLEALNALLPRWTPIPLSDLSRIRSETRAVFDRFFG
ncbi:MAG: (Glutamate--ammonia-ligase) adenylyltransferase [Bryobacterales bacterium]|nr:(Glutamate--ammonia-ligase) adenylyltransferase [Bryobacterales bacterium]